MKLFVILIIAFGVCLVQTYADSCEILSKSGANKVTVSTPVSFVWGSELWVPNADYVSSTPNANYQVTVTIKTGDGWTASKVNSPIAQPYGGSGHQVVTSINFKNAHTNPATGEDDSTYETVEASVFVFSISVQFIPHEQTDSMSPLRDANSGDDENTKYTYFQTILQSWQPYGGDKLGITPLPASSDSSAARSTLAFLEYEVDGWVTPVNLGYKPGGIPEAFQSRRSYVRTVLLNNKIYGTPVPNDNDDPEQDDVSGNPSKRRSYVYDLDQPGIVLNNAHYLIAKNNGDVVEIKWDFKEYWMLKNIQCSPTYGFSIRRTAKYSGSGWDELPGSDNGFTMSAK